MVGVPMPATFLMRSSNGSMPMSLAHMSITLSTAKCPIGAPGARYAADLGRLHTTSYPTARAFGMSYGEYEHRQAFITGEPGNAPAWNLKIASAATILPSLVTPTLAHMDEPEVGPVALNTSSRVICRRTGRPDFRESNAATGSKYAMVLPPKPPPISAGVTRRSPILQPRSLAVSARIWKWPWLEDQISPCPSASIFATQACGSI